MFLGDMSLVAYSVCWASFRVSSSRGGGRWFCLTREAVQIVPVWLGLYPTLADEEFRARPPPLPRAKPKCKLEHAVLLVRFASSGRAGASNEEKRGGKLHTRVKGSPWRPEGTGWPRSGS